MFVSSVQRELAPERRAIAEFIRGDALLSRFFEVFLFEELPASDRRADDVYLDEVDRCHVYIGVFGDAYGSEDAEGVAPTEREFDRATVRGKLRLVFVKGAEDARRHPKMLALIRKAGDQLIRRRFASEPELKGALYASLVDHLERSGKLRMGPFDASACRGATVEDIAESRIRWFLGTARRERQYALEESSSVRECLTHLNLLDQAQPTHAAILLFGREPQRFLPASEVKCLHFHGTEVRKPIPSYQVYKGTVFDLVDQSVDFVMSKLVRSVGTRERGPRAPVTYDLPREAVGEAIVNAVAHRDYTSNASVQVMLFADRLEVWNPGELPPTLTPERLRRPHPSIPRNPLLAEPLFLTRYIEKAGTGTLDMIARCREAGLAEPEFRQDAGQFVMTLWRDWLTEVAIDRLALNERQRRAVSFVRQHGRITNREYQRLTGAIDRTALRDLDELSNRGVLRKVGTVGRGAHYVLNRKTRHKPDKPDTSLGRRLTRQEADKSDRQPSRVPARTAALAKTRTPQARARSAKPASASKGPTKGSMGSPMRQAKSGRRRTGR